VLNALDNGTDAMRPILGIRERIFSILNIYFLYKLIKNCTHEEY